LPCVAVIVAILAFRLSGLLAAAIALATTLALWASGIFSPIQFVQVVHATADALVLEMLVGVVILFGLLFAEVSSRGGGLKALDKIVRNLKLSPPKAAILITLGIGVMLESLTGYGVSMLVTVPLLLQIVNRKKTIFLSLIGMSLMPWGALSVAALLGAELAGIAPQAFANAITTTSGPIAAILPMFCVFAMGNARRQDVLYALFAGLFLAMGIVLTSFWIGVEVAGVGGGLAVILFSLLFSASRQNLGKELIAPQILPYGLLIGAVVLQKFIAPQLEAIGFTTTIETERVSFRPIQSPGIALLFVAIVAIVLRPKLIGSAGERQLLREVGARGWRALTSIFLFLTTARLLVEIGGIEALSVMLSKMGPYLAVVMTTALGGIGAYVTGSGVAANALFMPSAAAAGESFDALALFAALQHSGASHAAIASLPILAILLAALPNREISDDHTAVQTALKLAVLWILFVIASGMMQLATRA
jgi:lactate permease